MVSSHYLITKRAHQGTARIARERLLRDRDVQRAGQNIAESIAALAPSGRLSFQEQRDLITQITRGFQEHYLSELEYDDQDGLIVAILRPFPSRRQRPETCYRICVDAGGNVNVSDGEPIFCPDSPRFNRQAIAVIGIVFVIVSMVLLF